MKQLIIISYKINVDEMSRDSIVEYFNNIQDVYSLKNDEELKENYIVREFFIPVYNGQQTDIQVIYPTPNYVSPELNKLADEISIKIKEDPTNKLKQQWERLVRELKLKKLSE